MPIDESTADDLGLLQILLHEALEVEDPPAMDFERFCARVRVVHHQRLGDRLLTVADLPDGRWVWLLTDDQEPPDRVFERHVHPAGGPCTGYRDACGAYLALYPLEPKARSVVLRRGGVEQRVELDHPFLVAVYPDERWSIERFERVEVDGEWYRCPVAQLPWSGPGLARAYARDPFGWVGQAFDFGTVDPGDLTFALLRHLDACTEANALGLLGAGPMYANGLWFYDRLAQEDVPDENLRIALSSERPEFLPEAVRRRYAAVMARLGRG